MQEIILEHRKYARGKYLRIEFVTVEWDRERRAFTAMVMFHWTRDRRDNKPLGLRILKRTSLQITEQLNL